MTSGKSTIGPILANVLGWSFYDLDNKIVEDQGRSIVDIFNDDGEEKFREIESETLKKLVKNKNLVIALGGGAIIGKGNLDLLKGTGKIIYLKSS
ncbi:MAG: shikimate kinase, partial [Candidatus Pacebacteria bacterium]|nr:shikimate kinase [Candidatus Paceibacterota bacterium]